MNIKTLIEQIDRELDGDLSLVESNRLHEFLDRHGEWRRYYESMKRLETAARSAPAIHPSPGFADSVMARIRSEAIAGGAEAVPEDGARAGVREGRTTSASRFSWLAASVVVVTVLSVCAPWFMPEAVESLDGTATEAMRIIESVGDGIAGFLMSPGAALDSLLAAGPGAGWLLALAAMGVVLVINVLYARKMSHA